MKNMLFFKKKSVDDRKKEIYQKFMENKKISRADIRFMKEMDWHPIDELNLKPKIIKKIVF